jgi:hypothetical protein
MDTMQVVPTIRLFCPYCTGKFRGYLVSGAVQRLNPVLVMNPISRRPPYPHICRLCGAAEGLADRQGGTLTNDMARIAIQNEMEECRRLPGYPAPLTGLDWAALYPMD